MALTEPATFYDQHPFDWVPPGAEDEIEKVALRPLIDLIERLDSESLVLDVGCGPGRVLGFLARRGFRCIGLDRSRISMGLAVARYKKPGVVGDNLHLPFASGIADVVISDGVIHHTEDPHAALIENCRVLKPGGQMYLGVYKPSGRYPRLYEFPGGLIRRGLRHGWSRPLVTIFAQVPYFLVHFVRSKGQRTWRGANNLFYDYFVTPRVAFLAREVVEQWCKGAGVRVARYDSNRGATIHSFHLVKEEPSKVEHDPVPAQAQAAMAAGKREIA
jgi:SAM-dependent methyltransferase